MNRNESWDALSVHTLSVHLAWASLEILVDEVDTIQLIVSGDDMDVQDLKVSQQQGMLQVEQPAYGLTHRIDLVRWMQLCIRLPISWKGVVEATTVAGPLNVRGVTGTDLVLETVSGDLRASGLNGLTLGLKTVTGTMRGECLQAEKAAIRTVSGPVSLDRSSFRTLKLGSVSADMTVDLRQPFLTADASTVSGDIRLAAPFDRGHVNYRTVTGKLRTSAVSLAEDGPEISVTSVSGNLYLSCRDLEDADS